MSIGWYNSETGNWDKDEPSLPAFMTEQEPAARMQTYRLEVRAVYPATKGTPTDIAAEVVMAVQERGLEVVSAPAKRFRRTDIAVVSLTFKAPSDETALDLLRSLPTAVRRGSTEADRLRTGTGRSWRFLR